MIKLILFAFFGASVAVAAPRTPKDDGEVLERLPLRREDPAMVELRKLSGVPLARRYFELAMAQGDPRYVGYAEGALRSAKVDDSASALYVRGLLRQYRHDFDGALQDLGKALQREPGLSGARAWRAAIYMVKADYASAARECKALADASDLVATGCRTYVEATTGRTRGAYEELNRALDKHSQADKETRLWALTRLAEMSIRLGDTAAAERHFRDALALGVDDNFLLAAYADFLLEQGRSREVVALLGKWARSDTLLLRLAIGEKRLGMKEAAAHTQSLAGRFADEALRGERLHLAEESRFLLELKGDAKGALAAATENWKSQREPRDALVLLQAAAAAKDPSAAQPALRWLEESRFEDPRLSKLAGQLR